MHVAEVSFDQFWRQTLRQTSPIPVHDESLMRSRYIQRTDVRTFELISNVIRRETPAPFYLEIGTAEGATTALLSTLCGDGAVFSVGLNHLTGEATSPDCQSVQLPLPATYARYAPRGCLSRCRFIMSDSLDPRWAVGLPAMQMTFIDGGHDLDHILNDTAISIKLMPSGGWIVWHDWRDYRSEIMSAVQTNDGDLIDAVHPRESNCVVARIARKGSHGQEERAA